jgi:hypothetical protein
VANSDLDSDPRNRKARAKHQQSGEYNLKVGAGECIFCRYDPSQQPESGESAYFAYDLKFLVLHFFKLHIIIWNPSPDHLA